MRLNRPRQCCRFAGIKGQLHPCGCFYSNTVYQRWRGVVLKRRRRFVYSAAAPGAPFDAAGDWVATGAFFATRWYDTRHRLQAYCRRSWVELPLLLTYCPCLLRSTTEPPVITDHTPEPELIVRVDGDQFVDAISQLAAAMVELTASVAGFEDRLSALEAKRRKGFMP